MAAADRTWGRLSTVDSTSILYESPWRTTGATVWVNSTSGLDANSGLIKELPKLTFDSAVAALTASQGDTLILMSGFSEDFNATAYSYATAGIRIIGEGTGTNQATLTESDLTFSGAYVKIYNVKFAAGVVTTRHLLLSGQSSFVEDCVFTLGASDTGTGLALTGAGCGARNSTFTATGSRPAKAIVASGAVNGRWLSGCTVAGGSYGWTGNAIDFTGADTAFQIDGMTTSGGSDVGLVTGCRGTISYTSKGTDCSELWVL